MSDVLPDDNEQNPCTAAADSFLSVKRSLTVAFLFSVVWLSYRTLTLDDFDWGAYTQDCWMWPALWDLVAINPINKEMIPLSRVEFVAGSHERSDQIPPRDGTSTETTSNDNQPVTDDSSPAVMAEFHVRRAQRTSVRLKEHFASSRRESEQVQDNTAPHDLMTPSTPDQNVAVTNHEQSLTDGVAEVPAQQAAISKVNYEQLSSEPAAETGPTAGKRAMGYADRDEASERNVSFPGTTQFTGQPKPNDVPDRENLPAPGATPFEVIDEVGETHVTVPHSKILQLKKPIYRSAIVDTGICEIVQFTPTQLSIIGRGIGSTHITFWFEGEKRPQTFLVTVDPDAAVKALVEREYQKLEDIIAELFPDSKVHLSVKADKLIVRGQAKCAEDAAQILAIIRNQAGGGGGAGAGGGFGGSIGSGFAASVLLDGEAGQSALGRPQLQVINLMRVPGIHQVALRVKIAEINRTAARGFGVDLGGHVNFTNNPKGSQVFLTSLLGMAIGGATGGNSLLFQVDGDDVTIGVRYLQQHGIVRLLSEPTLVTMSGMPATFVAGGEFAVPTIVGSAGLNAVTTDFRSFGAIVSFLPTVVDKDRIRLQISPEFSQINTALQIGNIPGLNTRSVNTTVEMREGQTLAIAGLLEDDMKTSNKGIYPFLYPWIGQRDSSRNETELLILVTPELVHPMDPEEVPPLPGFDMTEPDNWQFYVGAQIEGNPTRNHRSTVWPRLMRRYNAGGPAMISGPFGHGQ